MQISYKILFTFTFFLLNLSTINAQTELFFSEYIEGNSNNKAIELYNPTNATIDLSVYSIVVYSNGSTLGGTPTVLTGTIASHSTFVLGHSSGVAALTSRSNQLAALFFNGDDVVALRKNGVLIDIIGKIGEDPGDFWGVAPIRTQNQTLRRKPAICTGDTNGSDAFAPATQWIGFNIDDFTGLGNHSTDTCGSTGGGGTNAIVSIDTANAPNLRQVNSTSHGFIIVKEQDGVVNIPFNVQSPSNVTSSMTLQQTGGDGTLGTDVLLSAASFPANSTTTQNIQLTPVNDGDYTEGVEKISLTLSGTNTTPTGIITITLWIMDSDVPQKAILSSLSGTALRDALTSAYGGCNDPILYTETRDILYGIIERKPNLDVCGFYENHCINLPDGVDPSTYLYQNGTNDGINAEHLWPQSMGASGEPMKSDMHHLKPTRAQVNSTRNNHPYGVVTTAQATNWYYQNQNLTTPPNSAEQYLYSKFNSAAGVFMPRLVARGDAARASMYFYSVYPFHADASYWDTIKGNLVNWHIEDPIDATEAYRNLMVASYQCDQINPFILDQTLAARLLSSSTGLAIPDVIPSEIPDFATLSRPFPNPFVEKTQILLHLSQTQFVEMHLIDILGRTIRKYPQVSLSEGTHSFNILADGLGNGVYWAVFWVGNQQLIQKVVIGQ